MSAVSYADIQNAYNKLYAEIRKYIWDFATVAALADLEIAVYKTCQDLSDIRTKFLRLKSMLIEIMYSDEEIKHRLEYFEDLINEGDVYVKLNMVQEVIPDADN